MITALNRLCGTKNLMTKETLDSLTFYEILKVKPNSSKEEIRKSYLKLARKFHPDLQIEPNVNFK